MSNVPDSNVTLDIPTTMLLNMNGAEGDVECKIVAPSGREDDCFITPLGEGEQFVVLSFNEKSQIQGCNSKSKGEKKMIFSGRVQRSGR